MDVTSEWCNRFAPAPKVNGEVRLCLKLGRLNIVLIIPVHRGPTLNHILLRLTGMKYFIFTDASLAYYNLKQGEKSSYLTLSLVHLAGTDT